MFEPVTASLEANNSGTETGPVSLPIRGQFRDAAGMAGRIWTAISRLGRFIVRLWPISRDEDEALKELAGFYPGPNSIDQEQAADD